MNKKTNRKAITKVIASITSIIVLLGCMFVFASAAGTVSASTTTFTGNVGDVITIDIAASEVAGTQCGDLRISYDTEYLKYVADSVGAKNTYDADMCVGGQPQDGLVTCSFVFTNALEESDMKVCSVQFEVVKTGTSNIEVTIGSWEGAETPSVSFNEVSVNEEETKEPVVEPEVTTKEDEVTTKEDEVTTKKDEEVVTKAPVEVEDASEEDESNVAELPDIDSLPQTGDSRVAIIVTAALMGLASIAFVTTYYARAKKKD